MVVKLISIYSHHLYQPKDFQEYVDIRGVDLNETHVNILKMFIKNSI